MSKNPPSAPHRPPRRMARLLAGTAVAALTTTILTTPAAATPSKPSSARLSDPVGDVWTIGEGEDEEWTLADDMPSADVVGAVVRHRPAKLVIRIDFADLRRQDPAFYAAFVTTPDRLRGAFVSTGPGYWAGEHDLVNGRFGIVRCRGFEHSVDYAADRVLMSVPRTCLGRPRWVRVEMANYTLQGESEESFREFTDNPHTTDVNGDETRRLYRAS